MTFGKLVGSSSAAEVSSVKEQEFDPHSLVGESSLAVGKNASLTLGPAALTVLGTFLARIKTDPTNLVLMIYYRYYHISKRST